jgi:aminoglycoside 3-N-acetyltransferase|tara:strand:+ start:845 stop:1723 length:879 start_codon:yes stop_codon:yes gene_type:complete
MNLDDHINRKSKKNQKKTNIKNFNQINLDYKKEDIVKALKRIGVKKGDLLFISSNITFFGITNVFNKDELCKIFLDCFLKVVGKSGTLCFPTYSYSFGQNKNYDTLYTKSDCGIFSEFMRTNKKVLNYYDPNVSIAIYGNKKKYFSKYVTKNSYAENSFFDRFFKAGGKVCNLNLPAETCFVHYFERKLNVPYRYDKEFKGTIISKGEKIKTNSIIFVRKIKKKFIGDYEDLTGAMVKFKILKKANIGRGFILSYKLNDQFKLIKKMINKDKFFLTKGGKKKFKSFTRFTFY